MIDASTQTKVDASTQTIDDSVEPINEDVPFYPNSEV